MMGNDLILNSSMRDSQFRLSLLEKKIRIKFRNEKLLKEALTHKSFAMGRESGEPFNERLEFLGDSILNAVVTEHLFKRFPKENEGKLSKLKSQLVARASLVQWAKELNIGPYLLMSDSEEATGGRERDSLLANVMEALIGALFLDQGFEKAREFVLQKFTKKKRIIETDYKSKLQEIIQKEHRIPPIYILLDESGPDHDKIFHMEVRIKKTFLGKGKGKSKKEAEQNAAHHALKTIKEMRKKK